MKFEEDDNQGINPPVEDLELMTISDTQLRETLEEKKSLFESLRNYLPDRGDKLEQYIQRIENEIHRRNKSKKDSTSTSHHRVAEDKPSYRVNEQVNEMVELKPVIKMENETWENHSTNLQTLADKFPDNGKWIIPTPWTQENVLERRVIQQSNKQDPTTSSADLLVENKPSLGVTAQVKLEENDHGFKRNNPFHAPESVLKKIKNGEDAPVEDLDLMMEPDSQLREKLDKLSSFQRLRNYLPDKGDKLKLNIQRYQDEIDRRNKSLQKVSTSSSPDRLARNKLSRSHSGAASNVLTVGATKHDSLTDEKM